MAKKKMKEREIHKEKADNIAARIGSEDHHRKDGALYEHEAIAAQRASDAADVWQRIADDLAENKWAKL